MFKNCGISLKQFYHKNSVKLTFEIVLWIDLTKNKNYHLHTLRKLRKLFLTHLWQKFRESNVLQKKLPYLRTDFTEKTFRWERILRFSTLWSHDARIWKKTWNDLQWVWFASKSRNFSKNFYDQIFVMSRILLSQFLFCAKPLWNQVLQYRNCELISRNMEVNYCFFHIVKCISMIFHEIYCEHYWIVKCPNNLASCYLFKDGTCNYC